MTSRALLAAVFLAFAMLAARWMEDRRRRLTWVSRDLRPPTTGCGAVSNVEHRPAFR